MSQSFRTIFPEFEAPFKIDHRSKIWCMGSCFANELYHNLHQLHFNILFSPFGIAFNPISLMDHVHKICNNEQITRKDLIHHDGLYHSLSHHGSYSEADAESMLRNLNQKISEARDWILDADFLIITLGSAHYYSWKDSEQTVSNCHKIPASFFQKKRTNLEEVLPMFQRAISTLNRLNNKLKIILSVSPVRYLKDGFVENNRSKAILLETAHRIKEEFDQIYYFPAYEIFMDDLRDYRFCKSDLVHPSDQSIKYIMNYFINGCMTVETRSFILRIQKINDQLNHRPIHPATPSHSKFLDELKINIEQLKKEYPSIHFNWKLE
ncbi:MAG: GSCFA domain-containing protein [Saprospiraceae bacterium]|nr:GSCFA domain-containing protein [Saprospiraceae bacterium]